MRIPSAAEELFRANLTLVERVIGGCLPPRGTPWCGCGGLRLDREARQALKPFMALGQTAFSDGIFRVGFAVNDLIVAEIKKER